MGKTYNPGNSDWFQERLDEAKSVGLIDLYSHEDGSFHVEFSFPGFLSRKAFEGGLRRQVRIQATKVYLLPLPPLY